jgi:Flp pilus assembly protein TadB
MHHVRNDERPFASLPIVVGIVADDGLSTEAIRGVDAVVNEIVRGIETKLPHTPVAVMREEQPPVESTDEAGCRAAYLARHRDLIVTVESGRNSSADSVVGQLVRFRRDGLDDAFTEGSQLDWAGRGPLERVDVDTRQATFVDTDPNTLSIWKHIDRFNDDAMRYVERPSEAGAGSKLEAAFDAADQLAQKFQRLTQRTTVGLLTVGIVAALLYQGLSWTPLLIVVYVACLIAAYGFYVWSRRSHHEQRFQDYRALAEALRVQRYWRSVDIEACVAEFYLRRQQSELEWIRRALATWHTWDDDQPVQAKPQAEPLASRLERVTQEWVDGQCRYYERNTRRNRRANTWSSRAAQGLLVLGIVLFVFHWFGKTDHWSMPIAGLSFIAAALLQIYIQTCAFAEQAQQYERMETLFAVAHDRLKRLLAEGKYDRCQSLLLELGKEALAEHSDWLLLRRERPIRAPHPRIA